MQELQRLIAGQLHQRNHGGVETRRDAAYIEEEPSFSLNIAALRTNVIS